MSETTLDSRKSNIIIYIHMPTCAHTYAYIYTICYLKSESFEYYK